MCHNSPPLFYSSSNRNMNLCSFTFVLHFFKASLQLSLIFDNTHLISHLILAGINSEQMALNALASIYLFISIIR